ncbi:MAG: peptide/nickel transport system substrate-binding protein [Thermoanaerobaculia bacterium]|jgi:ABC-type transport system substrate-binding protein|nr:peptide/nickel transport system substrate-binding protein [Thermoanaerobaculia bacterium]
MSSVSTLTPASPAATASKSLRIGVLSAIGTPDPRDSGDTITGLLLGQVFEMAYSMTAAGTLEPTLFAEFLRKDRDGAQPVYSAPVSPGIFFSDGTELTAEIAATSLANAGALRGRATVAARDGRVVFTMSGPSPRFENVLCQWNTGIVLERQGNLYGTGPYRLAPGTTMQSMRDNGVARLEKNPKYRGKVISDELLFVVHPTDIDGTPSRLIDAAKRGDIDLTLNLSVNDILRYGINGYQPMMQPGNSTGILFFNNERPIFRDATLRRAIQYAINPIPIAEICYEKNHFAFLAGDLIPPLMGKVSGSTEMRDRELLRNHPNKPTNLTLLVPWIPRPYLPKPIPAAQEIARQLGAYGIQVKLLETRSSEHYFRSLTIGDYDLSVGGWVADNPDPAEFYESLLSSAQVSTGGQYLTNQARWKNAETDAALAAYRADPSPANRKVITNMIEREAILIPLIYGASTAIRSRKVKNFHIAPSGHVAFADVETF